MFCSFLFPPSITQYMRNTIGRKSAKSIELKSIFILLELQSYLHAQATLKLFTRKYQLVLN
jgi:hypothetical protein